MTMLNILNNKKSDFTIAVFNKKIQNPYGVVKTINNKLKTIEEKPITTYYYCRYLYN